MVAVESCGYKAESKLGICAVVRTTDDAEVELLVILVFVGIVEVVQKTLYPRLAEWRL